MLVSVVAIGNSRGVRIPKSILDQLQISDKVDLEIENQHIVLKPVKPQVRIGWDSAFKNMHSEQHDTLILPESDEGEPFTWEW